MARIVSLMDGLKRKSQVLDFLGVLEAEHQLGDLAVHVRRKWTSFCCWPNWSSSQAKEVAEKKAGEITTAVESLSAELRNEKSISSSALSSAKKASKENEAIKRAIQSLGCKVHFSRSGDCTVDIENSLIDSPQRFTCSPSNRQSESMTQNDEKSDLSVSITVVADDVAPSNPIGRVCEALCPLRTREGGCKWPDAGCAQLGSQFVGLKANFDAFDRLSIYDGYFEPK